MKKLLLLLTLIAFVSVGLFAAEKHGTNYEIAEENASSISYYNVPILKILEGKDGYVVIYQKNKIGVGNTVIPKAWAKGNPENPRKLKFRKLGGGVLEPYMTVVSKDGSFHRVILTVPLSKRDPIWGLVNSEKDLQGVDKEELEDLPL